MTSFIHEHIKILPQRKEKFLAVIWHIKSETGDMVFIIYPNGFGQKTIVQIYLGITLSLNFIAIFLFQRFSLLLCL